VSFLPWRKRHQRPAGGQRGLRILGRGIDVAWLTDDIAIAAAPTESQWQRIFESGISAVLEVRDEDADDELMMRSNDIVYLREAVADHAAPTQQQLHHMVDWVTERLQERRKVLIHCTQGLGRSATVGCATLVALGFPLDVAYQLLRRAQPGVSLSTRQVRSLDSFTAAVLRQRRGAS
jgi:predicted protein tyrosine phosphatase